MEWIGLVSIAILLCFAAYPGKVLKLESKVKKLEKRIKGENLMSRIISNLIGNPCTIKSDEALSLIGKPDIHCTILEADDDWIKIQYADKKGIEKIKIIRIDTVDSIEC